MRRSLLLTALLLPSLALAQGLEDGSAYEGGDDPRDVPVEEPEYDDGQEPIINGHDATVEDYPMTGGMLADITIESSFGSGRVKTLVCSSTLIAPDVVLLAAHCLDEAAFTGGMGGSATIHDVAWSRKADLTALDGTRQNPAWPEDAVFAVDWVKHQSFNINTMQVGLAENFDIALLFLEEPVFEVEHAYLPTVEEAEQIEVDDEVTVVGWGQQEATGFFEQPDPGTYAVKQMGVSVINEMAAYEMQIGATASDVRKCHGDSGGPTFMDLEQTDTLTPTRLVGVTSHAYDMSDCDSKGGVDTRVDYYLEWIDAEMRAACEDGTRVWCETEGIVPAPLPAGPLACGCSATGATGAAGASAWLLGLAGLIGLRRRRS